MKKCISLSEIVVLGLYIAIACFIFVHILFRKQGKRQKGKGKKGKDGNEADDESDESKILFYMIDFAVP